MRSPPARSASKFEVRGRRLTLRACDFQKHGECSESFYRKEIEQDVKSAPAASVEERRRMMDLLKRFEEDALEDSPLLGDEDDDEDGNDLHERLQNIDLGARIPCPCYTGLLIS